MPTDKIPNEKDFQEKLKQHLSWQEEFRREIWVNQPRHTDYEWRVGNPESKPIDFFVYDQMAQGFSRDVINSLHFFSENLVKLKAWLKVMDGKNEEERWTILHSNAQVIFHYCISAPYSMREKFSYHMAHLANQVKRLESEEDSLPSNHYITFKEMKKVMKNLNFGVDVINSIDQICDETFKESTGNFRNLSQHQESLDIEFGHTRFIHRGIDFNKNKIYGIGTGRPPLRIKDTIPLLDNQLDLSFSALEQCKKFIIFYDKSLMEVIQQNYSEPDDGR